MEGGDLAYEGEKSGCQVRNTQTGKVPHEIRSFARDGDYLQSCGKRTPRLSALLGSHCLPGLLRCIACRRFVEPKLGVVPTALARELPWVLVYLWFPKPTPKQP